MEAKAKTFSQLAGDLLSASERLRLLISELSLRTARTPETVRHWLDGTVDPPYTTVEAIARTVREIYGVDVTWQQLFPEKAERHRQLLERKSARASGYQRKKARR
ncbi:MAG: hypothetical protein LUC33_05555 [Prevotellaceae bacterium]|nr:hypothetical protein [Prevotellaceae bacterium]